MALQIISDLHLESSKSYDIFDIIPKAPYLALLGDIGTFSDDHKDDFLSFLTRHLQKFQIVFFVPGNHEAYGTTWSTVLSILRKFELDVSKDGSLGKFVLLERGVYKLPDGKTILLGCSLFSFVPEESAMNVELRLNDFFSTQGWTVAQHNAAHTRDLEWLNEQVSRLSNTENIVVLTHWSPSTDPRSLDPKHGDWKSSAIGCAFSTQLSGQRCFESEQVRIWAFGHTHFNCDFIKERESGPLRVVSNQRGYYFAQAAGFDCEKVLNLA